MRQKTIVITLGASRSTSGDNITVSTTGTGTATASAELPDGVLPDGVLPTLITTGDATAQNEGLTVVCQLDDAIGYICLAAKPTEEEPPPMPPGGTVPPSTTPDVTVPGDAETEPEVVGVASAPAAIAATTPDDFIAIVIPFDVLRHPQLRRPRSSRRRTCRPPAPTSRRSPSSWSRTARGRWGPRWCSRSRRCVAGGRRARRDAAGWRSAAVR